VRTPPQECARWQVSLYPDAAEAGGSLRYAGPASKPAVGGGDPERAQAEANRRARTKVRRYCAANRLNRLGTLTYAGDGVHDPRQVRADAAAFFRQLREGLGGQPLPYVWVPEWHPGGHGLHLHFAVGRYIKRSLIDRAWGHGFVHIKLLGNLPVDAGRLQESRLSARYLSKYIVKDAQSLQGLHRYEVAQGFQPRRESFTAATGAEALTAICNKMARAPEYVWWSSEEEDWQGPPAVWASWAA
jgi:hypothetical protein